MRLPTSASKILSTLQLLSPLGERRHGRFWQSTEFHLICVFKIAQLEVHRHCDVVGSWRTYPREGPIKLGLSQQL